MKNILLFWKIGKNIYLNQNYCDNIIKKYSSYYSYYYGNSNMFTRENLHLMRLFYINFPIYNSIFEKFSWNQYKLLLKINNKKERYFYFYLSVFFHSNYEETNEFITNDYYSRI